MAEEITATEFLARMDVDSDEARHAGPMPTFPIQPASGFESERLPMSVQPRIADERLDQISTGTNGDTLPEVQEGLSNENSRQVTKPKYTPEQFPYTYMHIDELGEWPRRLLHVSSMTSYEWQPGNVYRGCKELKYLAISYTWGRWKLRDGQKPKVKTALQIDGVPWQNPAY